MDPGLKIAGMTMFSLPQSSLLQLAEFILSVVEGLS